MFIVLVILANICGFREGAKVASTNTSTFKVPRTPKLNAQNTLEAAWGLLVTGYIEINKPIDDDELGRFWLHQQFTMIVSSASTSYPSMAEAVSLASTVPRAGDASLPGDQHPSPTRSDGSEDDEYEVDQDDAQSFMQPAISPLATLLTSPTVPAADKAAVLDDEPDKGVFEGPENEQSGPQLPKGNALGLPTATTHSSGHASTPQYSTVRLPAPWQAGPKQLVITEPGRLKLPTTPETQTRSRHQRSFSVGENALRRLSRALPSISIPHGLILSIPTPSFFSSSSLSSHKNGPPPSSRTPAAPLLIESSALEPFSDLVTPRKQGTSGSHKLRKTTSDESLLYHTLSRVSSLGDDERFAHVREPVNVRIKAIMDSFDGPSFKFPQMTNLLNTPLKKSATEPMPRFDRPGAVLSGQRVGQDPLDSVLDSLTGDIVIMGGYRGSILRSAKAPHRQLWVPVKVQLGVRKVNLEVGLDPADEESMEKHIIPGGMLQNIGPVDISRRLFKKLRDCKNARTGKLRVHDYGYDWRLSPHRLSRKLVEFLEKLPSNQPNVPQEQRGALVIAHSLGGLISRHAVNQRPDLFSGVLYAGVPQRCINILGPLRNGDAVLLNEKLLSAQVNFSLRTTFVFLPEDGFCFVDKVTKEEYKVDFYNVDDWIKYRWCPCVSGPALPALSRSNGPFGSFLSLSDSLSSLPLRSRSGSGQNKRMSMAAEGLHGITAAATKDRSLAPQMNSSSSTSPSTSPYLRLTSNNNSTWSSAAAKTTTATKTATEEAARARNIAYLARTLAETKRFRAELAHRKEHQEANAYPPLAVMYAKDIPTTYAASVAGREGIACADAYDDLLFRSGDGVVLAREAMLPPGYELVRDGRICTDRGHITMLGDLAGVGRALEALVRGRRKGIGLGVGRG